MPSFDRVHGKSCPIPKTGQSLAASGASPCAHPSTSKASPLKCRWAALPICFKKKKEKKNHPYLLPLVLRILSLARLFAMTRQMYGRYLLLAMFLSVLFYTLDLHHGVQKALQSGPATTVNDHDLSSHKMIGQIRNWQQRSGITKIVGFVFYGRRAQASILDCYLKVCLELRTRRRAGYLG